MVADIVTLRFESIAPGGSALARIEAKPVFVEGGAPDETACCRIIEEHKSWARAELLEIIEPSPVRISGNCAFYGTCGGCNLQHIEYSAQLAAKSAILIENCVRIGGFTPPKPEIFPSPPWEYRNRMQFHCFRQQSHAGNAGFGLKSRKSGDIIGVSDCPIADPGIRELLRNAADGKPIPLPPDKDRFTVYSRDGLFLREGGTSRGKTALLDKEVLLDAEVFFQSNGVMLEKLITRVREVAAGADRSLPMADLYAGVGTFAAFLAGEFPAADLVEENKKAIALARENLKGYNANLFALRDSDWVRRKKTPYGFAVVDPPRTGLSPEMASWLVKEGPPLAAYISCDPAALARDSKILINGGCELKSLELYDFYPQTAHIESLAVFSRKGSA